MATSNVQQQINLDDSALRQRRDGDDPRDWMDRKLGQAHALATMLYGGGEGGFLSLRSDIQDNVLWLLADTIAEVRQARDDMDQQHSQAVQAARNN